MKRFITYVMLVFAVFFAGVTVANAQSKALKKDVEKRAKELKKEGWKLQGSTATLEYVLTKYRMYMEEDEENRIALLGVAVSKNAKIGRDNAVLNGISDYASREKASIVGKMKSVASSDASKASAIEEIDKFGAAYETSINVQIPSLIKQHFTLVRTNKDGNMEFNVYMSIDQKEAKEAQRKAAEEARKQAALGKLSEDVKSFLE